MYRVDENPPPRYPIGRKLEEDLGRWAVAKVKSRREKAFAWDLLHQGTPYYLPLYEKRVKRRDNGKVRKSVKTLFSGYVAFVQDGANIAQASHHVADVIEVQDQVRFLKELQAVQRILGDEEPFQISESIFIGERVRIVFGPFIGIEGVVAEWRNTVKVGIGVQMFGQSIVVEADPSRLVKI